MFLALPFIFFWLSLSLSTLANQNDSFILLEKRIKGRIGVAAIDLETGQKWNYHENESFAMCSTFKVLLVSYVLSQVDRGKETLSRNLSYESSDILEYAPITSKNLAKGMTISELCAAAIQYSDNTAANLLLKTQGGPKGLTDYLRSIGDQKTHLDRIEPFLNVPGPKNLDSTTPSAMTHTLSKVLFGDILSESSRKQLKDWLLGNTTGKHRLKAGLPRSWQVADKTGTCGNGSANDVGVLFTPEGSPVIVSVFIANSTQSLEEMENTIAEIGKVISTSLKKHQPY